MKTFRRKENVVKVLFILSVGLLFMAAGTIAYAGTEFEVDFDMTSGYNYSLTVRDGNGLVTDQFTGDFGLGETDTVTYIDTGYMLLDDGLGVWVEALDAQYTSVYSSGVLLSSIQPGISGSWSITETVDSAPVTGDDIMVQTATEHNVQADDPDPSPPDPEEEGEENSQITYPRPEPEQSIAVYLATLTPEQAAHFRMVVRNRRALFNGEDPESEQLSFNYDDSISTTTDADPAPELPTGVMQMMTLVLGGVLARFRKRN
jgi:hypothetical protein